MKTIYIAETDEDGSIQYVWIARDGERVAMPFDPKRHKYRPDGKAEFFGARRTDIASWISSQPHRAS